jgi:hypothetical protein
MALPLVVLSSDQCPEGVQTRSFGDVTSMSGFPESGHGWAIYEYTRPSSPLARPIAAKQLWGLDAKAG